MGITVLEINNFKSYKGYHVIGPFKDFSCVIGPNGSGKSNVMDSIIFVLGHNSLQIRGTKLSELANSSVAAEQAAGNGHHNNHNNNESEDNSTFVAINIQHLGQSFRFSRKIVGSGSNYYFQGNLVSADQYQKHLVELKINASTKNFFIFQGDVETLATQSPKQITAFIEDLSGSKKLKPEYDRLHAEAEKAETIVHTAYSKRKAISHEKEQYRDQWSEVKLYHSLQNKISTLKSDQQLSKIYFTTKEMVREQKQLLEIDSQIEKLNDKINPLTEQYTDVNKSQASIHKELVNVNEEISKLEKSEKKPSRAKQDRPDVAYLQDKIKTTQVIIGKVEAENDRVTTLIEEYESKLVQLNDELEQLSMDATSSAEEEQDSTILENMKEYSDLKLQVGKETSAIQAELEELKAQQIIDQDRLSTMVDRLKEYEELQEKLQDQSTKYTSHITLEQDQLKKSKEQLVLDQEQFTLVSSTLTKSIDDTKSLDDSIEKLQQALSNMKLSKGDNESKIRFNQIVVNLRAHYPGVKGKLLDLCEPSQRKYDTALSATIGRFANAIVVDNDVTMMSCLRYLKSEKLCVATFLSLSGSLKTKPLIQDFDKSKSAKLLYECITFDKEIEDAILFTIGNTIVCDDFTEAINFAKEDRRFKVVTIEGTKISKAGVISSGGGITNSKGGSQWDDKRFSKLEKELAELLSQRKRIGDTNEMFNQRQKLTSRVQDLRSSITVSNGKIKMLQGRLSSTTAELNNVTQSIEQLAPQLDTLNNTIDKRSNRISDIQEQISNVEQTVFNEFAQRVGISSIKEYEESRLAEMNRKVEKRLSISLEISNIQSKLQYEKGKDRETDLGLLVEDLNETQEKLKQEIELSTKENEIKQKIKQQREQLKALREEKNQQIDQLGKEIRDIRSKVKSLVGTLTDVEKSKITHDFIMTTLRGDYHKILIETRNENIKLPIIEFDGKQINQDGNEEEEEEEEEMDESKDGEPKTPKSPSKKKSLKSPKSPSKKKRNRDGESKQQDEDQENEDIYNDDDDDDEDIFDEVDLTMDQENLLDTIIKDIPENESKENVFSIYEQEATIKFNFTSIDKKSLEDQSSLAKLLKKKELDIEGLKTSMANIVPNYKAFEHLIDVAKRMKAVKEELSIERAKAKSIIEQFNTVKHARTQLFLKAFKRISKHLSTVYGHLTRDIKAPHYKGSAHLALEDTECPFNAGVKFSAIPPNKRFQDMEQLSGGEKSIAALAFLFSTHSAKSTPFIILDEIDAAFDTDNVFRLVRYIRQKASKDLQFLVISLKEQFFIHSDLLIGICRDPDFSSKPLHLYIENYPDPEETIELLRKGEDETEAEIKTSESSGTSSEDDDTSGSSSSEDDK